MVYRHTIASPETADYRMPVLGDLIDDERRDHPVRMRDVDSNRNKGVLQLFLTTHQINEEAQQIFHNQCTFHLIKSIRDINRDYHFQNRPSKTIWTMVRQCSAVVEVQIGDYSDFYSREDGGEGLTLDWMFFGSCLLEIMLDITLTMPNLRILSLALCIKWTGPRDDDIPEVGRHIVDSMRPARRLDQFHLCLFNGTNGMSEYVVSRPFGEDDFEKVKDEWRNRGIPPMETGLPLGEMGVLVKTQPVERLP